MRKPLPRPAKQFIAVPIEYFNGWMKEVEPAESLILNFILRKTLGFQKPEDWISLTQFEQTGISRPTIIKAIAGLEKKEMIFRRREGQPGSEKIFYKLNIEPAEDPDELELRPGPYTSKETLLPPVKNFNRTSKESLHTIDNITIDKKNKDIKTFIDFFFQAYAKEFEGKKYFVNGGKDGQTVKRLLSHYGIEELKSMALVFLKDKSKFYQETGYTIGIFASQINKLDLKSSGKLKTSLAERERSLSYVVTKKPANV